MEMQQPFMPRSTFYPQTTTTMDDDPSSSSNFIVTAKAKVLAIIIIIVLIILSVLAVYIVKTNRKSNVDNNNIVIPSTSATAASTKSATAAADKKGQKSAKSRLNVRDIYKNVFDTTDDDEYDDDNAYPNDDGDEYIDDDIEMINEKADNKDDDGKKVDEVIRRHANTMKAPPSQQTVTKRVAKLMKKYKNPTPSAPYMDTDDTDTTRPPSTIDLKSTTATTKQHQPPTPVLLPHNSPLDYDGHYNDDIDFAKKRKMSVTGDQDNNDSISMASTTFVVDPPKKLDEKSKK